LTMLPSLLPRLLPDIGLPCLLVVAQTRYIIFERTEGNAT
jgi:hypothetical protein